MSPDDEVTALVRLLARYLRDNPLACDTAEGIARWWLAAAAPVNTINLARALDRMQSSGAIEALRAADGRVRYRRRAPGPSGEAPPAPRDGSPDGNRSRGDG